MASSSARSRGTGALCISLAISLGAHAAVFAALVQWFGAYPSGAEGAHGDLGGRGGGGPVFVALIGRGGASSDPSAALPSFATVSAEPETARPEPRSVPESATPPARAVALPSARPEKNAREPVAAPSRLQAAEPSNAVKTATARRVTAASSLAPDGASGSTEARGSGGAPFGPSAAGSAGGAYSQGALSRVARPASSIRPRYPDGARERGDEAEVIVEAWVAANGRVERARIQTSAGREFDAAALEAIHAARFYPASRDGKPVASVVAMRLHFELEH